MKNSKNNSFKIKSIVLALLFAGIISSCGNKSSKQETAEQTEKDKETDKHDSVDIKAPPVNMTTETDSSNSSIMWMPSDQPFSGQLKLVEGDAKKLNPTSNSDGDGSKILSLSLSGEKVLLLFDDKFENVGANLQFKTDDFQGQVAIVHHYIDVSNYDYLSFTNSLMQLGRIENGKNNVLDKKDNKMTNEWSTMRVSAAGEHYKGYLNDKLINHGHAEATASGRVGILLDGKGKVVLKMLEVMRLSE